MKKEVFKEYKGFDVKTLEAAHVAKIEDTKDEFSGIYLIKVIKPFTIELVDKTGDIVLLPIEHFVGGWGEARMSIVPIEVEQFSEQIKELEVLRIEVAQLKNDLMIAKNGWKL